MQITDAQGKAIEVTDLHKAITQARWFKSLRHTDPAYKETDDALQHYWNDIYIKLLQLKHQSLKIFYYQVNRLDNWKDWETIGAALRLLPDRDTAVRLAKRAAVLLRAEVRLTNAEPHKESGSYFRKDLNKEDI